MTQRWFRDERTGGARGGRVHRHTVFAGVSSAVIAAATLGLAAGGASAGVHAHRANVRDVRIAVGGGTDFSDSPVYQAMSVLKSEHYRIVFSDLADPSSALEAVASGKADIYLGDPMEAATAVGNAGAKIEYLASLQQGTDYEILSQKKFTLKNLAGATMGSAGQGTAGTIIANAALAKAGVDPNSIHDVTVGGTSARVTAILSGQVDLAPALAPSAVAAVATGKVKILLNAGKYLGRYLQQGLIASDSFVQNNPKTTQHVVDAFINAERWAATKESAYISTAAANQLQGSLTSAEEKASWQQLKGGAIFAINGAICPSDIKLTEHYTYLSGGSLTKANTPAYNTWVDPQFVKVFLKQHHISLHAC